MISVTILTKDVEATLADTLDSLVGFPEVIVLDNGSSDQTLEIAASYPNVCIYYHEFIGFGSLHNLAIEYTSYDWVLSIDADEVLDETLVKEILTKKLDENVVYEVNRLNFFRGKAIKWCGWYPERVRRLFSKQKTKFSTDFVHEKVLVQDGMGIEKLKGNLKHYSYHKVSDFLSKMQIYSSLFAEQRRDTDKATFFKAVWKSWFTFFRSYILQLGCIGGAEGYLISKYNADVAFYKYLKLAYKEKQGAKRSKPAREVNGAL